VEDRSTVEDRLPKLPQLLFLVTPVDFVRLGVNRV